MLRIETLAPQVRAALRERDPNLVTTEFRPLEYLVERATSPRRFLLSLLSGFSLIALLLACLGICGSFRTGWLSARARSVSAWRSARQRRTSGATCSAVRCG